MLTIENAQVFGFEAAIRGMRNPKNSWAKSDSWWSSPYENGTEEPLYIIGENDLKLASALANSGPDDGKFLRMIHVQLDVTAPLYWWKEATTYKVGTVTNSCSTMHKIHAKQFTRDDFSTEHLLADSLDMLDAVIETLNDYRAEYLELAANPEDNPDYVPKDFWWQLIQLLPSSYNQRRTWDLNYAVLRNIYHARKNHKLDEWRELCAWIETLPYAKELICG